MKTGRLLGSTVKDRSGRQIGSLEEIVVDRLTGRVKFAIVELDHATSSSTYLPVPWSALTNLSNDRAVRVELAARRIADAPTVEADDLASLERRDVGVEVYSYYGLQPPWEGIGARSDENGEQGDA